MTYRAYFGKVSPKEHTEVFILKLKRVLLLALVFCLALPSAQAAEKKKVRDDLQRHYHPAFRQQLHQRL